MTFRRKDGKLWVRLRLTQLRQIDRARSLMSQISREMEQTNSDPDVGKADAIGYALTGLASQEWPTGWIELCEVEK